MHDTIVAVLRGGPSEEHSVSLQSGATALAHLSRERFRVRDIYIDKQGIWHEHGREVSPGSVLPSVDVAFICVHGSYGHDGEIQKVLEQFSVPYTGADPLNAFHASHKVFAKEKAREAGLLTPRYVFVEQEGDIEAAARDAVRQFSQPVVVKPVDSGSSVGVAFVSGYQPVRDAITQLLADGARGVIIEERLQGTEATVGIVEGLRDEELYALPPVEIVPPAGSEYFSYEAKYGGDAIERCPGNFTKEVAEELREAARTMHRALGQRHYSRSDFIITSKGIYFLELNTAAGVGLTEESLLPKSLAAIGMKLHDFFSHIIDLAHLKGRR